jgi:hypothetical protein
MADLSPAAQAVRPGINEIMKALQPHCLIAIALEDKALPFTIDGNEAGIAAAISRLCAAALRAAADQVLSDVTPPINDYDEYSVGFAAAHRKYRRHLLAIAAELTTSD